MKNVQNKNNYVNYSVLWMELKDCKKFFNVNDLLFGILLGLGPSAYDFFSDFASATLYVLLGEEDSSLEFYAVMTYLFIATPAMHTVFSSIFDTVCVNEGASKRFLNNICVNESASKSFCWIIQLSVVIGVWVVTAGMSS